MYSQKANILLQGLDRRALTVAAISGLHCQIVALHWHNFTSHGVHDQQKHSRKADQLTLANGDSEHA